MFVNETSHYRSGKTLRSLSMALASSAVVIGFIGVAMPHPASAATRMAPRQEIVRFHDLDLSRPEGAERLQSRIRRAAKHVCSEPGMAGVWLRMAEKRCERQATMKALADASQAISRKRLAVRAIPQ